MSRLALRPLVLSRLYGSSTHILTQTPSRQTRPFRSLMPSVHLRASNRPFLAISYSTVPLPASSTEQSSEDAPAVAFKEEPIGLPSSKGFGYLDVNIGDEFGHDGCYVVLRKLGYGMYSNVWLARDKRLRAGKRFVALKILTINATKGIHAGNIDEQTILQRISEPPDYYEEEREYCLTLVDSFDIAREDNSGSHRCLVTEVLGKTLVHVRREHPKRILPLSLSKTVLRHILYALDYLHIDCDIIHTDIKADNIMTSAPQDDEIEEYVNANPPKFYSTMNILGHEVRPASQPITSFALHPSFKLADFGHAQWYSKKVTDDISPTALRAPETILKYYWDEKVDIWAIGCLTFGNIAGASLFDPQDDPEGTFSADDEHLFRMIQLTGQRFPAEILREARKGHVLQSRRIFNLYSG